MHLSQVIVMRVDKLCCQRGVIRTATFHQVLGWFGERGVGVLTQKVFLDLHHFLGARGGPLLLFRKFFIGVIKIMQIIVRDHSQCFKRANVPFIFLCSSCKIGGEDLRPHFFAFHSEATMPGQVIESERVQDCAILVNFCACGFFQSLDDFHLGRNAHIANAYSRDIGCVMIERLGDQPRRVGEISKQRARCNFTNIFRNAENDRDCAKRFCHASNAGRFLTDESVPQTEIFIAATGRHHADPQLCGHI